MNRMTTPMLLACAACSGTVARPVSLPESHWRLAELSGADVTPVGERGPGFLRFEESGGRFAASVGCNSMGGSWNSAGDSLTFSRIVSTLMACEEPLMTRERQLSQALSTTTRYRSREGRLELLAGTDVVATFTPDSGQ